MTSHKLMPEDLGDQIAAVVGAEVDEAGPRYAIIKVNESKVKENIWREGNQFCLTSKLSVITIEFLDQQGGVTPVIIRCVPVCRHAAHKKRLNQIINLTIERCADVGIIVYSVVTDDRAESASIGDFVNVTVSRCITHLVSTILQNLAPGNTIGFHRNITGVRENINMRELKAVCDHQVNNFYPGVAQINESLKNVWRVASGRDNVTYTTFSTANYNEFAGILRYMVTHPSQHALYENILTYLDVLDVLRSAVEVFAVDLNPQNAATLQNVVDFLQQLELDDNNNAVRFLRESILYILDLYHQSNIPFRPDLYSLHLHYSLNHYISDSRPPQPSANKFVELTNQQPLDFTYGSVFGPSRRWQFKVLGDYIDDFGIRDLVTAQYPMQILPLPPILPAHQTSAANAVIMVPSIANQPLNDIAQAYAMKQVIVENNNIVEFLGITPALVQIFEILFN